MNLYAADLPILLRAGRAGKSVKALAQHFATLGQRQESGGKYAALQDSKINTRGLTKVRVHAAGQ